MGRFLEGKVVAVTGAGRGIGRAVALACAAEGARVVVNDYGVATDGTGPDPTVAQQVVNEIAAAGGEAVGVTESVTTMEGGERIVGAAVETWGRLDGAVCAAGIVRDHMLFNMTEDDWDGVLDTHLKGAFTVFRAATGWMRSQRSGSLVAIASGGMLGLKAQANYAAAKAGMVALAKSAAADMYPYGVTANAVNPVASTRLMQLQGADMRARMRPSGAPEDVATLVVFLLSDAARGITGQVFGVNGSELSLWSEPAEVRFLVQEGRWTPGELEAGLSRLGQIQSSAVAGAQHRLAWLKEQRTATAAEEGEG